MPKNYQHALALVFAIKEINENPSILPNVTLGFHIYDINFCKLTIYETVLRLLSTHHRFVPNYKCDVQNNLIALVGGMYTYNALSLASIIHHYKIPQVDVAEDRVLM